MPSTTGPRRPALMLAVLLAGQFMVNVDTAVVNVAGPSVREDLRPSGGALELVVSGYTLAYAVLLVTGARLGQARGHRRMFLLGLGAFTAASLACGLAPSTGARLDLGGAALLSAAALLAVVPLLFGREAGWPLWTWASLAACVPVAALFVRRQRRAASPLLDLGVLGRPVVAWTLGALGAATGTFYAMMFVLALYLQDGLGRSALFSGLVLLPWVAAFGIAGPLVPRLPARMADRAPVAGYLLLASVYAAVGLTARTGRPSPPCSASAGSASGSGSRRSSAG
ncbi:MFS transporter [Spirillospora sp. CA-108201]